MGRQRTRILSLFELDSNRTKPVTEKPTRIPGKLPVVWKLNDHLTRSMKMYSFNNNFYIIFDMKF